jgi:hypothetical protein
VIAVCTCACGNQHVSTWEGHAVWPTTPAQLDVLIAAVKAIPPGCHSHSGLRCEEDEYGWCYLINRSTVLDVLRSASAEQK